MTSLAAEKLETLPGLHSCFTCADNLGCNLAPRCESMTGCIKWRAGSAGPRGGRPDTTMSAAMPREFPTA